MKPSTMIVATSISFLCLAGVAGAAGNEEPQTVAGKEACCFQNPRFSGTCRVVPGPDESCGDVLAYLNNPNSVGKSYCGNTKVRGGWTTVSCEEAAMQVEPATCQAPTTKE